jgi:ribosomal protein S18 acetylase RimI-like enzyme
MSFHSLDNPIWESLATRHREVALACGDERRYPAHVAPFLGIPEPCVVTATALERLVAPDERVFLVGPEPTPPPGWGVERLSPLVQMVCDAPTPAVAGAQVVRLTEDHRAAVLELTALVYPHYFRRGTMDLGRYFGVVTDGRLAAMAGERMATPGCREISAVCTHPDFAGRGLARALVVHLANDILAAGEVPFLHVSPANERAIRLYEQNGFRVRSRPAFWWLRRGDGSAVESPRGDR